LLEKRLTGVESNVAAFTGTLEHFLGRIQIDDSLRLVPDHRTIRGPPEDPVDIVPSCSASIVELDPHTDPDADATPLDLPTLDLEGGDENIPMIPSPVAGTVTTPSEIQEDDRMVGLPRLSPIPPEPARPTGDTTMAPPPLPPPPPSLNLIPPTPHQSQEAVQSEADRLEPGEIRDRSPPAHTPVPRARARSRTPFGIQPMASSSRLEPPTTRSRSRSKTPI